MRVRESKYFGKDGFVSSQRRRSVRRRPETRTGNKTYTTMN